MSHSSQTLFLHPCSRPVSPLPPSLPHHNFFLLNSAFHDSSSAVTLPQGSLSHSWFPSCLYSASPCTWLHLLLCLHLISSLNISAFFFSFLSWQSQARNVDSLQGCFLTPVPLPKGAFVASPCPVSARFPLRMLSTSSLSVCLLVPWKTQTSRGARPAALCAVEQKAQAERIRLWKVKAVTWNQR